MATTKISALTELTTPASADVLVINDVNAGSTKKIQLSNLIPDDAIDSEHYVAGSIDNEHLSDDAVGIDELSATGTASSSTFLRGDNSWVVPTDTNTTYSVQDGELSEINFTSADHTKLNAIEASATADQTAGEILTLIEDGIDSVHYVDASIDNVHLADDAVGIEELSATGTASSSTFLRGDNSWVTPTDTNTTYTAGDFKLDDLGAPDDNTDLDFTTSAHGLVPKCTDTGNFLKGDGTWAAAGGIASLLADTSPELGGDLDLNSNDITGTGGIPAGNLTGALPAISGASLTGLISAQMPTGSVIQVVTATHSTNTEMSTTSYASSGLSCSITPASSSNKILILYSGMCYAYHSEGDPSSPSDSGRDTSIRIYRVTDSTQIFEQTTDGLTVRWTTVGAGKDAGGCTWTQSFCTLDSPTTASLVEYRIDGKVLDSVFRLAMNNAGSGSTLTLMEVAG